MKILHVVFSSFMLLTVFNSAVVAGEAVEQFQFLTELNGSWKLAPASMQEGKATQNKAVAPLLGTDKVAMSFKVIGKGSTVQENLLPGTKKEMATMYHCDNFKSCQKLEATHYCAKQNQPELTAEEFSKGKSVVMTCNPDSLLCQSNEGHVHKIKHELISDNHLKTTYTIYKDGKFKKNSAYHFVRIN